MAEFTDPSIPALDPTIEARQEGYSWDDINAHIGQASQQAYAEGYTEDDVHQYLGGQNPAPFDDRLGNIWRSQLAVDPTLDVSDLMLNPTHRSDYAHGLKEGYVRGPQDFADRYAAAMIGAHDGLDQPAMVGAADAAEELAANLPPKRDFTDAAISLGGDDVAQTRANLIDHWRDTGTPPIDAAMQAQNDDELRSDLTKVPEGPSWFDRFGTGVRDIVGGATQLAEHLLPDGFVKTVNEVNDALVDAGFPLARMGNQSIDAMEKARLRIVKEEGYDGWVRLGGQMAASLPLFTTLGLEGLGGMIAAGVTGGALTGAFEPTEAEDFWREKGKQVAIDAAFGGAAGAALHGVFAGIGKIISKMTPEAANELRQIVPDLLDPTVEHVNLGAEQPVTEMLASKAHAPVEPAPMIEPKPTAEGALPPEAKPVIDPEAPAASKMQRIAQLHDENAFGSMSSEQPNFFQGLYEKAVVDGHMAADAKTEKLAIGHDMAGNWRSSIGDMFTGMMKDETGAVPLPALKTPQQIAAAGEKVEARNYLRDLAVATAGERNQASAEFASRFDKMKLPMSKHIDEWDKQLTLGPAGNPQDTVIGKWLAYVEGRSAGVTLDPNNPLTPFADTVRDAMQAVDKRLRQQDVEGIINYKGYVEDYLAHMFKDPSGATEYFNGSGKLGSKGNLMERKGPPTILDAVLSGKELKITNPYDLIMTDINNKLRYSYAADMFDKMHTDGMTRWGVAKLPGDVEVGTSFGRKQLPADAIGKIDPATGKIVESGAPHEVKLFAHPELVKNLNYWLQQVHYSDATASTLDKLLYAKNTMTGLKLLGPMFHAVTEAVGGFAGEVGRGMEELGRGQLFDAIKSIVGAPIGTATLRRQGKGLMSDWASMSGDRTLQLLTRQNPNMGGQHVLESFTGRTPGLGESLGAGRTLGEWLRGEGGSRLGTLPRELRKDFQNIWGDAKTEMNAYRAIRVPDRTVQAAITEVQRLSSVINDPLFKGVIPYAKLASSYRRLDSLLRSSSTMSEEFVAKRARQISEDVENRMGELNLDNLFWPKLAKQTANLSLISTSWVYGSYRGFLSAAGYNLQRGFEFNPTALTSTLATVVTLTGAGAMMNYLHTGELPDPRRLGTYVGQFFTGGTGTGLAKGKPALSNIPSELKEVVDIGTIIAKSWQNPWRATEGVADYALGKLNPMWQVLREIFSGHDAIGHDIYALGWKHTLEKLAADAFLPISVQQFLDRKSTVGLNKIESIFGFREGQKWAENWDGWQAWQKKTEEKSTKAEVQRARRENADLETPHDLSDLPVVPAAVRSRIGGGIANGGESSGARSLGNRAGGGGITTETGGSRGGGGGGGASDTVLRGGSRSALSNRQLSGRALRSRAARGRRGRRR